MKKQLVPQVMAIYRTVGRPSQSRVELEESSKKPSSGPRWKKLENQPSPDQMARPVYLQHGQDIMFCAEVHQCPDFVLFLGCNLG